MADVDSKLDHPGQDDTPPRRRGGIARTLIIFIVLFSSLITLVTTAIQLYFEYAHDIDLIERRFDQVRNSYQNSIEASVWVFDRHQLQIQLDGIAQLPDIIYAEAVVDSGIMASSGTSETTNVLEHRFALSYEHRGRVIETGELKVVASLAGVYERLLDRFVFILVSNGVKTFFVAIFIFFLFDYLVTRHLKRISGYARQMAPERLGQPLTLDRAKDPTKEKTPSARGADELDDVASALNEMRLNLSESYQALEISEQRFRQLAENLHEVLWVGSPDWRKVYYISPTFAEVWGVPCEELYKNPKLWLESIHPDDTALVIKATEQKAAGDLTSPYFPDYRVVRGDGAVRWIRARAFPVRDGDGQVIRIAGIAEDITERKTAEIALRDSEARFRNVIESTAEGFWRVSADGKTSEVNTALCRLLGYEAEEILGHPPSDFVPEHALQAFKESYEQRDNTAQRDYEAVYRTKDGTDLICRVHATSLFDASGALMSSYAFVADVSKQKAAEAELRRMHAELERRVLERTRDLQRARNEAIAANRAKSEFLANMSHELRTPLNAILGFSDSMLQAIFGPLDNARYEEYVRHIHESGRHLLDLINDLLDVSAIEAGRMGLVDEDVDMVAVADSCFRLIRERAAKGRIGLTRDVAADLPHLRGDGRRVKQVVLNLLTNAVKFTPEQGTVSLAMGLADNGDMVVTVQDSGIGMAPHDVEKALQPFSRSQAALDGHYEGTGLGLPLAAGLVEAHDGKVAIDSAVGKGTRVRVFFPADRVMGARETASPDSASAESATGSTG